MCDCITKAEEFLNQKMQEEYPDWEVIEPVEFQNKTWILGKGLDYILKNEVLGKVQKGKSIRKFTTSILPTYCSMCGKKLSI